MFRVRPADTKQIDARLPQGAELARRLKLIAGAFDRQPRPDLLRLADGSESGGGTAP